MTEIIFTGIGAILVSITAIFLFKKPKRSKRAKKSSNSAKVEALAEIHNSNLPQEDRATMSKEERDSSILPENHQQRNLDREVGGLEEGKKGVKEKKDEKEKAVEDIWDDRSEAVDEMGSFVPLAGSSKESMTWRLKKIRLGIGKHLQKNRDGSGTDFDSRGGKQGFSTMIKARQDHENDGGGMGMGR